MLFADVRFATSFVVKVEFKRSEMFKNIKRNVVVHDFWQFFGVSFNAFEC